MTRLILSVLTVLTISTAAQANDDVSRAALYYMGVAAGSVVSGNPQGYYANPDPLRITRPQYNAAGGVMPLSKGGSLNPNRTSVTDTDGVTVEVAEWTDFRGNKHVEIEEY